MIIVTKTTKDSKGMKAEEVYRAPIGSTFVSRNGFVVFVCKGDRNSDMCRLVGFDSKSFAPKMIIDSTIGDVYFPCEVTMSIEEKA